MMNFIHLTETESTNKYAKKLAQDGASEFTVVIADRQTGGYGRMGRSFYSPSSSGLYMSIVLRPVLSPQKGHYITTAAAVAVSEAIEEISNKKAGIKWVNDIFIDGKKVCGILTEAGCRDDRLDYAILGIGVNIYTPSNGLPDEIKDIAGCLFDKPIDIRSSLVQKILYRFNEYYRDIESKSFLPIYREKSIIIDKPVTVINGDVTYTAKVLSIDDDLHLVVEDENKNTTVLYSGEISVRM